MRNGQSSSGPGPAYEAMLARGEIEPDPAQRAAVDALQALAERLGDYRPAARGDFFSFFARSRPAAPRGLYLHGGVGRGKTLLMDLFFETVDVAPKRRVHFHEFMAEVHALIGRFRKVQSGDPIPLVAESVASDAVLLCFDEMHVTDIADAMILGRLFAALFEQGVVVVATSNLPPRRLYEGGLNRALFVPFIRLIEAHMNVLHLAARRDYRLEKLQGSELYFTPADSAAREALTQLWRKLTGGGRSRPAEVTVNGRTVMVPEAAMGAARFRFADLCGQPLGAADYLHIAHTFHTVVVEDIPVMGPDKRDMARRFVNLIDTLYDNGVRLIASAEAEPHALYPRGDGADLFQRTASRLMEMRSQDYVAGRRRGGASGEAASA